MKDRTARIVFYLGLLGECLDEYAKVGAANLSNDVLLSGVSAYGALYNLRNGVPGPRQESVAEALEKLKSPMATIVKEFESRPKLREIQLAPAIQKILTKKMEEPS